MKKTITALFVLVLFSLTATTANNHYSAHNTASAQQDKKGLKEHLLDAAYVPGKVIFDDGSVSEEMLNYFINLNQVTYINEKGDTLVVSDLSDINLISYGNRIFIPLDKKKVAEVVKTFGDGETMLMLERQGKVTRVSDSSGPYGTSTETASISRLSSMHEWDILTNEGFEAESMYARITKEVFIVVRNRKQYKITNLKSLRKIFSSKWNEIKDYDKQYKPDLKNVDDVIALLEFCVE